MGTTPVWSVDPRTGKKRARVSTTASTDEVDAAVRAAATAGPSLTDRERRAYFLRAAAATLEDAGPLVVETADIETAIGPTRLAGELARTCHQLRAFADVVDEGAYLDVVIDHADPDASPVPLPDLRRYRIPRGVVAVFSASNFPLAFSVPGGDTASALAAGCPVVVKAHENHPATSDLCARLLRSAAAEADVDEGVVGLIHGRQAGLDLVRHPLTAAVGFTGSVSGGRALFDAAAARPHPIPFHGELGSLNPVILTESATAERAEKLGAGLAASFTLGMGQLCTKPGLVLVPAGPSGDRFVTALTESTAKTPAGYLLDARMRDAFLTGVRERAALPDVSAPLLPSPSGPVAIRPGFLASPAHHLTHDGPHQLLLDECFGPVTVIARYDTEDEIAAVLAHTPGNLTATIHLSELETRHFGGPAAALLARLTPLAGRIIVNAWPTGVAVSHAQHHGGPYPAATSAYTSVGTAAIERWLRPVAYQNTPPALLPPELRDDKPCRFPRRVDGRLELPIS